MGHLTDLKKVRLFVFLGEFFAAGAIGLCIFCVLSSTLEFQVARENVGNENSFYSFNRHTGILLDCLKNKADISVVNAADKARFANIFSGCMYRQFSFSENESINKVLIVKLRLAAVILFCVGIAITALTFLFTLISICCASICKNRERRFRDFGRLLLSEGTFMGFGTFILTFGLAMHMYEMYCTTIYQAPDLIDAITTQKRLIRYNTGATWGDGTMAGWLGIWCASLSTVFLYAAAFYQKTCLYYSDKKDLDDTKSDSIKTYSSY